MIGQRSCHHCDIGNSAKLMRRSKKEEEEEEEEEMSLRRRCHLVFRRQRKLLKLEKTTKYRCESPDPVEREQGSWEKKNAAYFPSKRP